MVTPVWQLSVSSQHMVKSLTLNPYMCLFNLKLCTHIWSTNINFTLDFLVCLGLNFHPMGEFGGSVGPATYFFVMDGQKRDYLSRTYRALLRGGAIKKQAAIGKSLGKQ